jgi:hypothetical protein
MNSGLLKFSALRSQFGSRKVPGSRPQSRCRLWQKPQKQIFIFHFLDLGQEFCNIRPFFGVKVNT